MALDRQSIEKKDFPVGRRGYDPEAVDAHLAALAEEVSEFKRTARRRADTLASSASEQVRAIVEAAENSAADIQRDAENEARDIRDEANREAQSTREQAASEAREYVGKVSESTSAMLERVDSMQKELSQLIESLRTGGNRLGADLALLESSLTETKSVISPGRFEPEPEPEVERAPERAPEREYVPAPAAEPEPEVYEPPAPAPAIEPEPEPEPEPVTAEHRAPVAAGGNDDAEGARLIALNMALNGTPREETERYLSENFQLSDAHGLLDEVYASVEG